MSRILKNKKKVAIYAIGLTLSILLMSVLHFRWYMMLMLGILYFLLVFLNEGVCRKMYYMHKPFEVYSEIRNVDYLLIGDFCNADNYVPKESTYVQISAPNRGFNSSYQILRHTHSILKEKGGTVIMAIGNNKKNFMIFDIPFLHNITIKKYNLEGLRVMSRFPFFFAPIDSLRFLWGGVSKYAPTQNTDEELSRFCKERDYKIIYLEKV